jgi:hypothetical protein
MPYIHLANDQYGCETCLQMADTPEQISHTVNCPEILAIEPGRITSWELPNRGNTISKPSARQQFETLIETANTARMNAGMEILDIDATLVEYDRQTAEQILQSNEDNLTKDLFVNE